MLELDGATLTYNEFKRLCLVPNRPAIIRNACQQGDRVYFNLAEVLKRLCPQALCDAVGPRALVPVYPTYTTARGREGASRGSEHQPGESEADAPTGQRGGSGEEASAPEPHDGCCTNVPLSAVLQSWTRRNTTAMHPGSTVGSVYYLKDWHLQEALEHATVTTASTMAMPNTAAQTARHRADRAHAAALYRVPDFLGADWMDPFCRWTQTDEEQKTASPLVVSEGHENTVLKGDADRMEAEDTPPRAGFGGSEGDYRFAYFGPVGSWTPLHCDVFGTYSWSFNVCGDKLWFFPTVSGNAFLHVHIPPSFPTPPDLRVLTGVEVEGVTQHPGDLVFVPSRYYHQVHNISGEIFPLPSCAAAPAVAPTKEAGCAPATVGPLTMSLNHNWCNVFNIACMTRAFLDDAQRLVSYLDVTDLEAICDTTDVTVWRAYVDRMLHSGTNWSYASMTSFLAFCLRRIEAGDAPEMVAAEGEREMAAGLLRRLLADVTSSHEELFST